MWQDREKTGFEVASEQRPVADSPADVTGSTEELGRQPGVGKAPETIEPSRLAEPPAGEGEASSLTREADVERPQIEEKPIEDVDVEEVLPREPRRGRRSR